MIDKNFYSIRMHASAGAEHVSGAERIVTAEKIDDTVCALITRARNKGIQPDQIRISIDNLGTISPKKLTALDITTVDVPDAETGRSVAKRILIQAGLTSEIVRLAMQHLTRGAAPSGANMRGAMIMDSRTGERLEPDPSRGVRASRFDWSDSAGKSIQLQLDFRGLSHYRIREAVALATKVAHAPGFVAELCWSDDPEYTAGYVASLKTGYVRFPRMKEPGNGKGGRAIFIDSSRVVITELIDYLQAEAVLIDKTGRCNDTIEPEKYFEER